MAISIGDASDTSVKYAEDENKGVGEREGEPLGEKTERDVNRTYSSGTHLPHPSLILVLTLHPPQDGGKCDGTFANPSTHTNRSLGFHNTLSLQKQCHLGT